MLATHHLIGIISLVCFAPEWHFLFIEGRLVTTSPSLNGWNSPTDVRVSGVCHNVPKGTSRKKYKIFKSTFHSSCRVESQFYQLNYEWQFVTCANTMLWPQWNMTICRRWRLSLLNVFHFMLLLNFYITVFFFRKILFFWSIDVDRVSDGKTVRSRLMWY